MKAISESKVEKIAQEMLDLISSTILNLECMNVDMEHEFGNDILNKKIGEGFKGGACRYSLRDRYGAICDKLLSASLTIAKSLRIDENEFRQAIDEIVGNSRIYDGEYVSYIGLSPSADSMELNRGSKRWWKARSQIEK